MASIVDQISQNALHFGENETPIGMHWPVGDRLHLKTGEAPRFTVTVDTEEEFDWQKPFDRGAISTSAISVLPKAVNRFNALGIKPAFLCDYPVVTNPISGDIIGELCEGGRCEIGTHLHPWVTPPHEEAVNLHNSFTGNLPQKLQWEKLCIMTDALTKVMGKKPTIFRAGRYGLGTETHAMLAKLGYQFDVSIRPGYDYSSEGGPDFRGYPIWPWKTKQGLIEIPLTFTNTGILRNMRPLRLPGMSKLGLQARIPLTPEGIPAKRAVDAIEQLHADGCELYSLTFHSPSLCPGHTSYVRNSRDLDTFWRWWDIVASTFDRIGVKPATHAELLPLLNIDR